jgi:hypothetical protein
MSGPSHLTRVRRFPLAGARTPAIQAPRRAAVKQNPEATPFPFWLGRTPLDCMAPLRRNPMRSNRAPRNKTGHSVCLAHLFARQNQSSGFFAGSLSFRRVSASRQTAQKEWPISCQGTFSLRLD